MSEEQKPEKKSGSVFSFLAFVMAFCALILSILAYLNSTGANKSVIRAKEKVSGLFKGIDVNDFALDFGSIAKKIKDTSTDFKLSESYDSAKEKMAEITKDLKEYQTKVTPKYKEKYDKLMTEAEEVYAGLKAKTNDAGDKLEKFVKKVDNFLSEDNNGKAEIKSEGEKKDGGQEETTMEEHPPKNKDKEPAKDDKEQAEEEPEGK